MTLSSEVREATPELAESWNGFVEAAGGSVCQLFGWRTVVERAYGHRCFYLLAGDADEPAGILPLTFRKMEESSSRRA